MLPQYVVAISKIKNPNLKKAYQDKANVESTINVDDYVKSMLEEASARAKEREEKESIQKQVNELKDTEQSLEREYISKANRNRNSFSSSSGSSSSSSSNYSDTQSTSLN